MLLACETDARCILQSRTVVSREPVTRQLLSGERARQVTGAQCPLAVSKAFAPSDDISLILLSTCPPVIILLSQVMETMAELLIFGRPVPVGPIPAVYSLSVALISAVIFTGTLFFAAAEIWDTQWFQRRSKTSLQWLCASLWEHDHRGGPFSGHMPTTSLASSTCSVHTSPYQDIVSWVYSTFSRI